MRIAFLTTGDVTTNASQPRAFHLAKYLAQQGESVGLFALDHPANRTLLGSGDGIEVYWHHGLSAFGEMWTKSRYVKSSGCDVVHIVGVGIRSTITSGRPFKRPLLIYDYDERWGVVPRISSLRRLYLRGIESFTLRRAHAVVVASQALLRDARSSRPDLKNRILYLPIGFDPNELNGRAMHEQSVIQPRDDRKTFLYVGGILRRFRDQFMELVPLAKKLRGTLSNFVIKVVGGGEDLEYFRNQINAAGVSESIELMGWKQRSELGSQLAAADVFLFPYPATPQNEYRCPTKVFEFAAANKPVVTNPVGEVKEALGEKAYYYEYGNTESMVRACERALADVDNYDIGERLDSMTWQSRAAVYYKWLKSIGVI